MTGQAATTRGARVAYIPPPLYYGAGFAAGMVLDNLVAAPVGGGTATVTAGAVVGGLGLALAFAGVGGVIRHRTTIVPHHPVSALVTTGAYRRSRNPMYAGLAIAYLGAALLVNSWWPIALLPAVLFAVQRLVIHPEERYLAERFGDSYAGYRARVRKWL
jgi:protein-S-isoprenylcysteine O-methyltransferase Ste14